MVIQMRSVVVGILVYLLCSNAHAEYVYDVGEVERIELTAYWGGYACMKVNNRWYHFKYDTSGPDFIRSTVLAAKLSKQSLEVGSNTDSAAQVCGSLTSYPILVLKVI